MSNRIDAMAEELIYHRMTPRGECLCGHKYRLGESIMYHRAQAADMAITLYESGVPIKELHDAVATAMRFKGKQ